MKVLFLVHNLGKTRHFERVIQGLTERGHSVVITAAHKRNKPLKLDQVFVSQILGPGVFAVYAVGAFELPIYALIKSSSTAAVMPEITAAARKADWPAVLGIWRAGASLLALDPKAPRDLSQKLVQGAGAQLLLHADDVASLDGVQALPLLTALAAPAQNAPTLPADALAWLRVLFAADGTSTMTRIGHAQLSAAAVGLAQLAGSSGGRLAVGLAPLASNR